MAALYLNSNCGMQITYRSNDMAKEFARPFYNSKEWKKLRQSYIKYRQAVDGGLCETCHEVPGYIVHHKIELTPNNISNPEISLGFDNLKYDCHICHNKENQRDEIPGLVNYRFGENGEIVPEENQNATLPPKK